jgi:type II secretory pathway pseudopilin PulG
VSLVETMIALVVIVVGLAAVQRVFPQQFIYGTQAIERTQATLLGRGKLEQLRLEGFDTLAAAVGETAPPKPFLDSQQHISQAGFRWRADVRRLADDLLEVHLYVLWPWPQPTSRVYLATYVNKR